MKRILITGKNSYVGNSFEKWVEKYPKEYEIKKISLRDDSWKGHDFSIYDVVLHVAGIAHRKETKENRNLYYEVNRDLAFEVAKKAKKENVSQFIFLSSMSVYGMDVGIIDKSTVPKPTTNYGKSKLEAERLIDPLNDETFRVATLRPPMIYGSGCKGNYPRLAKLALKMPVFPNIYNERSMIYVDNLSEFIRVLIDLKPNRATYFPQNENYISTKQLVETIASVHGKRIKMISIFNGLIKLGMKVSGTLRKLFGSLVYDKELSIAVSDSFNDSKVNCEPIKFNESIRLTEKE